MSSLTGLAQFTNRFAQNIMGYEDDKKKESERVADKEHERGRQQEQDLRAQQNHDVTYESNKMKLGQDRVANDEFNDVNTYAKTGNQLKHLQSIGAPEQQSIDVLTNSVNSNSKLPYTIEVERDQAGKIIQRQDQNGKPFYFQTVIDKETGEEVGRKATTLEGMTESYTQLQRGGAIEAEVAAMTKARQATVQDMRDKLTLKRGEAGIDQDKYAANKGVDVEAHAINKGVDFGYQQQTDLTRHGYALDKQDNAAGHSINLANVNSSNRVNEYVGRSDVDAGGTPIVGGSSWGSFDALIGPESNGQQLDKNGRPLTSSAGAIGIAQVMPDTAKYVANKHGIPWNNQKYKTDSNYNYQLGQLYFKEMLDNYKDPALAYAAYNAGPGAVNGWLGLPGSNQSKYKAIPGFASMTTEQKIKAIPFAETKNYVAKIHRQSGGVQVQRSVPAQPKATKGTSKAGNMQKPLTVNDYNTNITKGVDTALKGVKSLGIKPDAATTATYARAGTKLKEMGTAKNEREFLDLYQEAFNLVISAVPKPRGKNKTMSKADKNALGHKVLLSMVGASSLGDLKKIVYDINPAARSSGGGPSLITQQDSKGVSTTSNPFMSGSQTMLGSATGAAATGNNQQGKLAALYSGNGSNISKATNDMMNLGDDMEWN